MKSTIIVVLLFVFIANPRAQQFDPSMPVDYQWENRLGNHQTGSTPDKGQYSVFVIHNFDPLLENGTSDLFGIYGTANIQMGLEYGFSEPVSLFFLTEKINKAQELGVHFSLAEQTIDNSTPFTLGGAFSVAMDARDERYFGDNYYFINRFFYTTQFIASKYINHRWSVMLNTTLAHHNIVEPGLFSTFLSVNPSFSYQITRNKSVFLSSDFPLGIASASEVTPAQPKPLLTIGTIIKSATHNFQLFVTNVSNILPANDYLKNDAGFDTDSFRFGFNIHVKIGK